MKILVTGANGQLGRELKALLDVSFPDCVTYTDVNELDLTDANALREFVTKGEFSHIINCAAYTAVDRAEEEAAMCTAINADAVKNIASVAWDIGAKVLHISTDYVFNGNSCRPYRESDKVNPLSQYGATKRKGETYLLSMCPNAVVIRTAWLYSPHGKNFVKTMLRKLDEGNPFSVVADQVGTPTSATDLARAIVAMLKATQWCPGLYHFTNEGVASWYDFAVMIARLSGRDHRLIRPITTDEYPTAATRPQYSVLDKTLFKKTFNYVIPHWVDALEETLSRL
ncbi:MAG: dTDP-4-dehydrorhamnose reductase [Muribaculaceae bacterium]|nr:dTDP-4-dehydrorhamnose reductase [Muribaculaceae bacterium]